LLLYLGELQVNGSLTPLVTDLPPCGANAVGYSSFPDNVVDQ